MYESDTAERYVGALVREIKGWSEIEIPTEVDTIYFGGGTPSLLSPTQLERILSTVAKRFDVISDAEITLEINPGDGGASSSARLQSMRYWRRLGINRASFGAQTFSDRELKLLGRTHDSKDITATFYQLREAGFVNINFDLIAGLPGQTLERWQSNLTRALELKPEHLSLYLLDVHEGTPLADQIARGMRPGQDEDLTAQMYLEMIEIVSDAGYKHYEISNFCSPGFESRHNSKYWSGAPYYGFGNSAHSFDGALRRWANVRDQAAYVASIEHDQSPVTERTNLTEADARSESVFLGMRLMRGINLEDYRQRFRSDLLSENNGECARLIETGLIEIDGPRLKLTTRGALLSNEVFAALA